MSPAGLPSCCMHGNHMQLLGERGFGLRRSGRKSEALRSSTFPVAAAAGSGTTLRSQGLEQRVSECGPTLHQQRPPPPALPPREPATSADVCA